ncbi:peroxiredoxin [Paenibacillus endophyticus]|uniref:Peroxiredoxin n=1 Tax=Paenibacillus endophyticus TaxID=1294268 RepID=A0A7W5CCU2_9BACL|nr:TlpA disulfide reductase family protein [Paenibacillus endophyticus]MBB3155257.1 peroxiredoxin [Paenibacillus endophyticus]
MKKNVIIGGIALLLFVIAAYATNQYSFSGAETSELLQPTIATAADAVSESPAAAESIAPIETVSLEDSIDFTLTDLDGNEVNLKDLRGKSVYLNFWATWCKWCKKELPDINKVNGIYKDQDLVVLAVSVGESQKQVSGFMKEHGYDLTTLVDPDKKVAQEYGVTALPVSIFIDKNGKIAHRKLGTMYEEELKKVIDGLLISS